MHATKMHFAFLSSKSVNTNTDLGKRILAIAARHHEIMVKEMEQRALEKQKVAESEQALSAII